jgi:DNA-binding NtrC family response regulator
MLISNADSHSDCQAILVVENNPFLCEMICDWLLGAGYAPHPVEDEQGVLEALKRQHIDLVLLDLDLGRDEGISLLASVQSKLSGVPLVLLTGAVHYDDVVARIPCETPCVTVEKPYSFSALGMVVEEALARSRAQRMLAPGPGCAAGYPAPF